MKSIKEVVFKLHNDLMKEKGIDKESALELEIRPRNGITSETIVTLLLDIEEELGVELDDYLALIRECKTIGEFIQIIEKVCKERNL